MALGDRIRHAWNAFSNNGDTDSDQTPAPWSSAGYGASYGIQPDRTRIRNTGERSLVSSIYTRISIDAASVDIRHVRLDTNDRYLANIDSPLNKCLTVEANLDQAATDFRQDLISTMLDKGVAVIVPVDTDVSSQRGGGFDVYTARVGEVVQWYPKHVRVSVWNTDRGMRQELTLLKRSVAVVPNPFYTVMNQQNSTLQRLLRKLTLLDIVDEQSSSGKLDIIIQLPYVVKTDSRRQQAEQRRKDIEVQLKGSKYGIAYTDGTEKITQLNRPTENNLMSQVETLTEMLYGQLGITKEVMNGTADEATMLNYMNRTIEPILNAVTEAMIRSFLTQTARTQGQSILYFKDPFKLVPVGQIAEIADKFTRNEILSANEMRGTIGFKPSTDSKADELRNSNVPQPLDPGAPSPAPEAAAAEPEGPADEATTAAFGGLDAQLDELQAELDA